MIIYFMWSFPSGLPATSGRDDIHFSPHDLLRIVAFQELPFEQIWGGEGLPFFIFQLESMTFDIILY